MTEKSLGFETIKIVGLPKGSIMWPTAAVALILGIVSIFVADAAELISTIFLIVFSLNLLVLFFDFSRGAVVGIFGLFVALIAIAYSTGFALPTDNLLNEGAVGGTSPQFLILYGTIFLILLLLAILFRRAFEYFEISSNEIVRKTGILGDAERYSAPNVQLKKEIDDVFESLLLFGAGDLKIVTAKGQEFNIENVPRINKVEDDIRRLLGRLEVHESSKAQ